MWGKDFWNLTWSRPYGRYNKHHEAIWKEVEPLLKGRVLDLGCGPCVLYKGKNVDLTGVDISEQATIEAKKNYPQGKYVVASADSTGLEGEFDTVVMFGLLDYFTDWKPVVDEARRLSKGSIYATLLHGFQGHDWERENIHFNIKSYKRVCGNWILIEL